MNDYALDDLDLADPEPDPNYWLPLSCGCPVGVVADEGHQEGCDMW